MASAAVTPPRFRRLPPARTVTATALATLAWAAPVCAQTMEERARTAAQAARAKTSDSEALRQNYVTPGLGGEPIRTVDNSRTFNPQLSCRKTATLMEVLVQPSGTGDLAGVQVARDTDLDGTIDSRTTLPVAVSGICANGVIACQPGTWNQCTHFRWDADAARTLKLTEVDMPELAGCYCINNSCGANLAWSNMASLLGDLGGGIIGALTTADPRIGVAEAVIDGPMIRYVGAQSTACSADPSLPQPGYRPNPGALAGDAFAAATSSRVFQALAGSATGLGTAQQLRHCTIERQVTVFNAGIDDIITRTAGGYSTVRSGRQIDFYLGSPADDSLRTGRCSLFDFRMTLRVGDASHIVDARLAHLAADDWAQLRIDGVLIASGEEPWTSTGLPPGACEKKRTFHTFPDVDLKPYLTPGDHEIWLRVAVSDGGDGFAQVHVEGDDGCRMIERLVDACGPVAQDPKCRIDSEMVDGVQTFRNGVNTGLRPLPQTRMMGTDACPLELTRDFFQKNRTYRCEITGGMPQPDLSRGAYILDRSTETVLADRVRRADGSHGESTRPFSLPDRGSVAACEPICKTRALRMNNAAAPAGVTGSKQNDPISYDSFYHSCGSDNLCPLGVGEEIVSACGCLDDFPEAVVMMQAVRLAGADLVCTRTIR